MVLDKLGIERNETPSKDAELREAGKDPKMRTAVWGLGWSRPPDMRVRTFPASAEIILLHCLSPKAQLGSRHQVGDLRCKRFKVIDCISGSGNDCPDTLCFTDKFK